MAAGPVNQERVCLRAGCSVGGAANSLVEYQGAWSLGQVSLLLFWKKPLNCLPQLLLHLHPTCGSPSPALGVVRALGSGGCSGVAFSLRVPGDLGRVRLLVHSFATCVSSSGRICSGVQPVLYPVVCLLSGLKDSLYTLDNCPVLDVSVANASCPRGLSSPRCMQWLPQSRSFWFY